MAPCPRPPPRPTPAASSAEGADALAPGQPLPPAPLAGLTEPGPGGVLPVIAADGRTPAQAYARPFRDTGQPKVALVIGGLGLNAKSTRQAIEQLPPEVTLSFVPYAEGLQGWIDLARASGHEVLLEAPMEPLDYPQNDPGPYTLMAHDPASETTKRMEWLLSRAAGYFGVTNYLGGRFMASDPAMNTFAGVLRQRGLAFIDDGSASGRGGGAGRASADRIIDQNLDDQSIAEELGALESVAGQRGAALGAGFSYPRHPAGGDRLGGGPGRARPAAGPRIGGDEPNAAMNVPFHAKPHRMIGLAPEEMGLARYRPNVGVVQSRRPGMARAAGRRAGAVQLAVSPGRRGQGRGADRRGPARAGRGDRRGLGRLSGPHRRLDHL